MQVNEETTSPKATETNPSWRLHEITKFSNVQGLWMDDGLKRLTDYLDSTNPFFGSAPFRTSFDDLDMIQ